MAVLQGYRDVSRDIRNRYERKPLFTMDVTKNIIDESKGVVPVQQEPTVQQGQVVPPRNPVLPPDEERDNAVANTVDPMDGKVTTSRDIRSVMDKTSVSKNPTVQKAFEKTLSATIGPLASLYTAPRAFLGAVASTMESFEGGVLGDVFGTREAEVARDNLEDSGYSRANTAAATAGGSSAPGTGGTRTEMANVEMARASGDSGAGDSSVSKGATAGSGAPGTGGTAQESAAAEMGRASGFGTGTLGDAAAGDNDGPSEGGGTGRGSSDNDSSPGGIGGV